MSNNFDNDPVSYRRAGDVAVDAGLRIFFRSVYNYMIAGLALTGVVGYGVAFFAFQDGSPLGAILYGSPVAYVVMFAPLVLSLIFGGRIYTMRPATAQIIFWLFAALMGVALSSIMAFAVGTVILEGFNLGNEDSIFFFFKYGIRFQIRNPMVFPYR